MKFATALVLALCLVATSIQPAAAGKQLKLGHMMPLFSTEHACALKFKELVEERSKGDIEIVIYPAAQLGHDSDLLEALQFGTLDLGVITTSPQTNFAKEFGTLDVPFLFKDWSHVMKFIHSDFYDEFLKSTEKAMFYNLALMPRGYRDITNSKRPIRTPEDLKGLKIRVIESPVFVQTFDTLGASPQAMSWGEVFTALQQGTIDGQENTLATISYERVYEVQKYISKTQHIFAFASICASKMLYDNYTPEEQTLLHKAARDAAEFIANQVQAEEVTYAKELTEKGMEINEVDGDAFRALIKPVQESIAKRYSYSYYNKIKALAE